MPVLLAALPALLPAIGAAGSLAGTGLAISNAISGSGGQPAAQSAPPATAAQNVAAEVAKRQQDATLVNRQIPGLVDQTSGGLSDQAYQTYGSNSAGLPGTFGQGGIDLNSIMQFLGGQGSGSGSPTNLMSLATGPSITG